MAINFKKFEIWRGYIKNLNNNLYNNITKIMNDVNYLSDIQKKKKKKLIPTIKYDENELMNIILFKLKKDKLKFKYNYEKFCTSDNMDLLHYLLERDDKWLLNETTLNDIFIHFERRFRKDTLREKCLDLGYEYTVN